MCASRLEPRNTLFYDVDTQRDFILPEGALYVAGSEALLPTLEHLTRLSRDLGIRRICSTDRHFPTDAELKRNGGAWPDHCMDGTPGQHKVAQTAAADPCPVPNRELDERQLQALLDHSGELVIEKQDVDVVKGNRNARSLLERLVARYENIVVYGVYTDVCVDYAVQALLSCGKRPIVIGDAVHPVDPDKARDALRRWKDAGVQIISCAELEDRLGVGPAQART